MCRKLLSMKRVILWKLIILMMLITITGCVENQVSTEILGGENNQNYNIDSNYFRIINKVDKVDIDEDGTYDNIMLYFKDGVRLKVKDREILVLDVEDEKQIFDSIHSDQYIFNLYISGNKILVGYTYHFTQKYGSTSELKCYKYVSGELKEIWSSFKELDKRIIIDNYDEANNCISVSIGNEKKKIILDNEDEQSYLGFTKRLKEAGHSKFEMEFRIIPDYVFQDIDNDANKELITRAVVTFGACPITEAYYSVYKFSGKGMEKLESWFGSAKPEKAEKIEFN